MQGKCLNTYQNIYFTFNLTGSSNVASVFLFAVVVKEWEQ